MQRATGLFGSSVFLALACLSGPASAAQSPNLIQPVPIIHTTDELLKDDTASPYAMNYTDEAAQTLGVSAGHADLFNSGHSNNAYVPSFSGGLARGGLMMKLQWHPGE